MSEWLPTIIALAGIIATGGTTIAVVAARVGKMEQRIVMNATDIERNSIRIKLLENENIASGIQLAVIKGDLGYIRIKIDKHLEEDMSHIKEMLDKIVRTK